jgi:8-oxo-dGTP diphosphatase
MGGAEASGDGAAPIAEASQRVPVEVAVGVLIDGQGRFLMCTRPQGKVCAGQWEFPGGKLEPGESIEQALQRELTEELGIHIDIGRAQRWRELVMDYPHARVRLHFCKVYAWTGEFEMREGQTMAWQRLPVQVAPLLAGSLPVLDWLAAEVAPATKLRS